MKKAALVFILSLSSSAFAFAQSDTTYLYFDKDWKSSHKDSAHFYGKVYKNKDLWYRKDFWVKNNILQMEGSYLDKGCTIEDGYFVWYDSTGNKESISKYENGKAITSTLFYANGSKKAFISYSTGKQQGWDENGKGIKDFIIDKPAQPIGGSFKNYLEENLNGLVADQSGAPMGSYTVKVQFVIDKEGNITDVVPAWVPEKCLPCGYEAVRVIRRGPKWHPAIQSGKPVIYKAVQFITFVAKGQKRRIPGELY
jgi:hypothetical protein